MEYNVKRKISSGEFGTIYEIEGRDNGNKTYALKELSNINSISKCCTYTDRLHY